MLKTTAKLVERLKDDPRSPSEAEALRRRAEVAAIARLGGSEDEAAVRARFLDDMTGRPELLSVLFALGTDETAAALFEAAFVGGKPVADVPDDVLRCIGRLGHAPALRPLWEIARGARWSSAANAACLGLLDLDLSPVAGEVVEAVLALRGLPLVNENLPMLAARIGRPEMLDVLLAMGRHVSTDCNGGLILGVALFGEAGRPSFETILADADWEAAHAGAFALYAGARHLGIDIATLCRRLRFGRDGLRRSQVAALLDSTLAMIGVHVADPLLPRAIGGRREDGGALLEAAFAWSTPNHDDTLAGIEREFAETAPRSRALAAELRAGWLSACEIAAVAAEATARA